MLGTFRKPTLSSNATQGLRRTLPTGRRLYTPTRPRVSSFYDVTREFVSTPGVYLTGKAVVLFTMFYTTINWFTCYKRIREEMEKEDREQRKDKKDKKL